MSLLSSLDDPFLLLSFAKDEKAKISCIVLHPSPVKEYIKVGWYGSAELLYRLLVQTLIESFDLLSNVQTYIVE